MPSLTARTFAALTTVPLIVLGLTAVAPPSLANGGCGETFSGGSGTPADPFLISSVDDAVGFGNDAGCWQYSYLQTRNLDFLGLTASTNLAGTPTTPFSGVWDGGGHVIRNLKLYDGETLPDIGGLFGYVTGTIKNVGFVDENVTETPTVAALGIAGGLVGLLDGGVVSDSFVHLSVAAGGNGAAGLGGTGMAGGLVGVAASGSSVTSSYSTGSVQGEISNTTDDSSGAVAGGLIGYAWADEADAPVSITMSYSTATVRAVCSQGGDSDSGYVGGLIGYLNAPADEVRVADSYASGALSAQGFDQGTDDDCQDSFGGGLAGVNQGGLITDSYSNSSFGDGFTGTTGGLVGVQVEGTVRNSFWDVEASGQVSSAGGTGKTTIEMRDLDTFTGAGWSISKGWSSSSPPIWGICAQMNSGYPFLNWSADVNPCGDGPFADFTFSLPTGEECTSISPVRATIGQQTRLPGADADCATMPGSKIIGWTVPAPADYTGIGSTAMPFEPGHLVNVVGAQQFTAVLWEPVIEFRYDANIGAGGTCEPGEATHTSNNGHLAHIWVPREDFTDARFPTTTPCTPPGHELQAWNSDGDGTGQTYTPGNPLPETWVSDTSNTHTLYGIWRHQPAG